MTTDPTNALYAAHPKAAFIHASALIFGDVELADDVTIWPYAVLRGDMHQIRIGARTNIQDHAMLHIGGAVKDRPDECSRDSQDRRGVVGRDQ